MEITPGIRAELEKYLEQKGLSKTAFGHISGLNPGTVSGIVTGNKSISVNQLDLITLGMELPPDHFYERYIEEYIIDEPLNWRKISPYLYRCVELHRLDCLKRVVYLLLDYATYPPLLYGVAENVFKDGYNEAAAFLYTKVAESEKQQHSERLAVCQYRLFKLTIGKDQAVNLEAAAKFESFITRLDEIDQLDALKDLTNVYRSMGYWDKTYTFAKEMGRLGKIQYDMVHNSGRKEQGLRKKLSRPLFVYIAYADLLCANACDAKGHYDQALEHLRAHTDLSWVKEQDSDTLHWMGLFQRWGKINTYVNRLMSGDVSVLPDYVEYMAGEQQIFAELLNVIETANRYDMDVDHILQRFETQIAAYQEPSSADLYTQQVLPEQYVRFWYKMAKYSLNKGRYPYGLKCLINAFEKAVTINHALLISNCSGLFDRFRVHAAPETLSRYEKISQEVWERNDQKDGFVLDSNWLFTGICTTSPS
ncbi:helix-turn-helix domain-containing protein [Paenibacillus sp. 23TSA30-6]|uniref:helix-turn-helix domain-containing protein n=1 Tax=Paenibacillus sp. 23TSA30-6 TaxID=2546104 RepID=UPI0017880C1E|nr:helix-turn-helix transcriptional regulator [Paenibacillus sp. 23TSA30-6]MBE0339000.1 XRE family transcriptional regulator [Paenibacillus sp. 23TSA30-6]